MFRMLLYYLRMNSLRDKWRRTHEFPMLSTFLEHNPLFRQLALLAHRRQKETQKKMQGYSVKDLMKSLD